jgi:4'-phosphopantetheinyl transferase
VTLARGTLDADQIHVWQVGLLATPQLVELSRSLLVADELRRAERRVLAVDAQRFLLSHVALRCVLARYLGIAPAAVPIVAARDGKPRVDPTAGGVVHFNLSHSGDLALIALSRDVAVGVDVERVRPWRADVDDTPAHFFSRREQRLLATIPARTWPEAFTRCWTRKEAIVKAIGAELPSALADLDVGVWPLEDVTDHRFGRRSAAAGCTLAEVPTAPGYVASAAWRGHARRLVRHCTTSGALAAAQLDRHRQR